MTFPESIDLEVPAPLEVRTKFIVGYAIDQEGNGFFVKIVNDEAPDSAREDLANEIAWNTALRSVGAGNNWSVPEVINYSPDFEWAVFEFIEGTHPGDEELEGQLSLVVGIVKDLMAVPLNREETGDMQSWAKERLTKFESVLDEDYFDDGDREAIQRVIAGDMSVISPGVVHGDLNPQKNIITTEEGQVFLLDSELGTDFDRPDWDKPRYHDAAYFYHLLRCQYHRPDLAANFLDIIRNTASQHEGYDEADFTREFFLSVLERTVSMMNHFVTNLPPEKIVDDPRRLEPQPYIDTIRDSLKVLT